VTRTPLVSQEPILVIKLTPDQVSPTPETVRYSSSDCFSGIGRAGDKLIILLDAEKMFNVGELDWTMEAA